MTAARSAALVVRAPGDVALEPRPAPAPADGELLILPEYVGLCGTDLEIIDGLVDPAFIRYPIVLGHEWTGTAAEGSVIAGSRVVGEGIVPCGHCARCRSGETNLCETYDELGFTRDGAAAGHVVVPATLVHRLTPGVSGQDAALVEPASVAYRALAAAGVVPGSRALVIGDGTIALLAAHLLGLWSPAEIVMLGRRTGQASLAAAAGAATFATTPAAAGQGFDLVVEAAGTTDAALAALAAARRGGTVVLVGLPPNGQTAAVAIDDLVNNDLRIFGSFGYTSAAWRVVVGLLNAGRLRPGFVITHRFRLGEYEQALATLRGGASPRGKVLLCVDGH